MILLAVAGAWAISTKSDAIAYAAHAGDHAIYPDCREEFVVPLSVALRNADWHPVAIARPYLKISKADIVKRGFELHAPMADSYSCYQGRELHCGKCGTCTERKEAFEKAGVTDPTSYEK
jgi:7-cyano-7-deazaguanine synthase